MSDLTSNQQPSVQSSNTLALSCVCPCCGADFHGSLIEGCTDCGARAVGAPLARPEHELPAYGRSLFLFACGVMLLTVLISATLLRWYDRATFDLRSLIAAAETAAWQLKSSWLPLSFVAVWTSIFMFKQLRRESVRYGGVRLARCGVVMSITTCALIVSLIGITIPERLRQRELAKQAKEDAILYAGASALLTYSARYGTLPGDINDLRNLPDPDGRIAAVIANFREGEYIPSSSLQASTRVPAKARRLKVRAVNFNANSNITSTDAIVFTNYNLVWAGTDGIIGTPDDRTLRDGLLVPTKQKKAAALSSPPPIGKTRGRANNRGSK